MESNKIRKIDQEIWNLEQENRVLNSQLQDCEEKVKKIGYQFKTAQEEYSRITWKIDNILSALQSESGQPVSLKLEDHQILSEIVRDFNNYNVHKGQEMLGKFFKSQGRRYTEELRHKGYYLNPTDASTLEGIVGLFYK